MCFVVDTWQLPFILVSFCALTGELKIDDCFLFPHLIFLNTVYND